MTTVRYSSVLSAAHNRAVPVDNFEDNFYKGLIGEVGLISRRTEVSDEKSIFYQLNQAVIDSK